MGLIERAYLLEWQDRVRCYGVLLESGPKSRGFGPNRLWADVSMFLPVR